MNSTASCADDSLCYLSYNKHYISRFIVQNRLEPPTSSKSNATLIVVSLKTSRGL